MENLYGLTEKPVQTETRQDAKLLYFKAAEKEIERLYADRNYKELIDMYQPIDKKLHNNIDPETVLLAAKAYSELKLYNEAISAFSEIKPNDLNQSSKGRYIHGLADAYLKAGFTAQAQELLEKHITDKLDTPELQGITLLLAGIYLEKDMLQKAYALYESVLNYENKPGEKALAETFVIMGNILRRWNSLEKAEYYISEAIQIARDKNDLNDILQTAHMEMGIINYTKGNYAYAAESFENGFSLGYSPEKKDYWENRFMLASAYLEKGENSKAVPLLEEISAEGDTLLQKKAQIRIGTIDLDEQLKRLSINER
jgi:FimV-like protein